MPTMHFGVIDIPYAYERQTVNKKGKVLKRRKKIKLSITTGQVAEFLENDYHIMETFYERHKEQIVEQVVGSYLKSQEALMMGAPATMDPFASAAAWIETRFKQFISNREMEGLGIPGVPTEAARKGVSHRFARPYARRSSRPSFLDTGLYQSSFKVWTS